MKKTFVKAVLFVLSALNLNVSASEQIYNTAIEKMSVYDTYAVIKLKTPGLNSEGCSKSDAGRYASVSFDTANGREMYSALLSAKLAKAEVGLGLSGCRSWGSATIPLIYRVDL